MKKTLALIHTSMVFINVETMMFDIFQEVMPDVKLINLVDDTTLGDVLRTPVSVQEKIDRLIDLALSGGGNDNITVVLVDIEES